MFVDTAPVMEKPLAQAAGIGWQGKHTNLVSREHGSWLFLGVILTSLELEPDAPADHGQHCGSCTRCLDACPTQAFVGPHRIDARRCISYLTIEHDGPIPDEFRSAMGNRIYGCDDCLAVCPWNRFADAAAANRAFLPRAELAAPRLADLLALDDAAFREMFAGSPIKRIGRNRMIRNCLIAAGNSGDAALGRISRDASRRSRSGDRRSGAMGACSARIFERGDAGRLIGVGAGRRARIDIGHRAARRSARGRDRRRARSWPRNCSLRLVPSCTCSAGLAEMRRPAPCVVRPMSCAGSRACGRCRLGDCGVGCRAGGADRREQERWQSDDQAAHGADDAALALRRGKVATCLNCAARRRAFHEFPENSMPEPASTCCASAMPSSTSSPTRPTTS